MKKGNETLQELGFRNVVRLGYVSLFTDISTEMILGVLPIFIIGLGASAAVLGIIEGVAEASNYLFRVFSGILTDRIGQRKPLVLVGYGLSSIAKPLFAVTGTWGQAFAVRVIDRAGKGTRTSPRDALISDSIKSVEAGKAFGIHRSLDQVGAVLGPLLAFAVIPLIGIRGLFWISLIPAAVALLLLLLFVRDTKVPTRHESVFKDARKVLTHEMVLLLAVIGVFNIGAYDYSFILLKAGLLGINDPMILTLVYATLNIATVILGYPSGILADKIGKIPVLVISYAMFLITSFAGFSLFGNWMFAFVIAFFFGCYLAISDTVQRAMIPEFTQPELKGTAYALYYALIGSCYLVANSVFGFLWTNWNPSLAFQYSVFTAAAGVVALVGFVLLRVRSRRSGN
jgi:MFS family permease